MAKFSGKVGYIETEQTSPGVWTESKITERQYYGDLVRHYNDWSPTDYVSEDIKFGQDISIVADPYMYGHLNNMRYVVYKGVKWRIDNFEVDRPRVKISLGGEYYGDEA